MQFTKSPTVIQGYGYWRVDSDAPAFYGIRDSATGGLPWEVRINSTVIAVYADESSAQGALDSLVEALGDVYEM